MIDTSNISKKIGKRKSEVKDDIDILRRYDGQQNVWGKKEKEPEWARIAEIAEKYLSETRDLKIAIRLAEAYTSEYGFAGLARSLEIINFLWNNSYPQEDIERENIILWIGKKLPLCLYNNINIKSFFESGITEEEFENFKEKSNEIIDQCKEYKFVHENFITAITSFLSRLSKQKKDVFLEPEKVSALFDQIINITNQVISISPRNITARKILTIIEETHKK